MRHLQASGTGISARVWLGVALSACIVAALAISSAHATTPPAADPSGAAAVTELRIDSEIEPVLAEYIVNGIAQANRDHSSLILITINTPGGLDSSMREIIGAILESKVPVVTYVYPTGSRAASAGFFILLSADVDAMSPGTDTGAASPVFEMFGQTVQIDETMRKKVTNEATAYLRSYVAKRGRNVDLAVTAVSDAKAFTEKEALDGKLIELIASSPEDLLAKLNGRTITRLDGSTAQLALANPVLTAQEMTAREKILMRIVQPDVFFILLIVGVLGLYTEFTHPGLFAPGVIGGIALLLALFSMHMLPVNFTGLLLIVLAIVLFVLEAKYPTHGILGIGGVISMVLGALMLIRSPLTGGGVSAWLAFSVAIPFAIIIVFLARLVLRSRTWKASTGREEMVGEEGEVTQALGPAGTGMVFVHGELWRAAAPNGLDIPQGARVRVRRVEGLLLHVEPVKSPQ
ncbi:MAG TPA: nodulation protein NfeD [Candidatus Limnocylindrales bacterium]|nr:nodulation protein NfeD [Candidatus Limnocylindrales bacterium]